MKGRARGVFKYGRKEKEMKMKMEEMEGINFLLHFIVCPYVLSISEFEDVHAVAWTVSQWLCVFM